MTGARIRSQAPLINHVNNDAVTWATMWRAQVRMGIIPYYMFVERDTGAKHYFEVNVIYWQESGTEENLDITKSDLSVMFKKMIVDINIPVVF